MDYDPETGFATIEQRNKFVVGDNVEFMTYSGDIFKQEITEMYNSDGDKITEAPHPQQIVKLKVDNPLKAYDMMRMESKNPVTLK